MSKPSSEFGDSLSTVVSHIVERHRNLASYTILPSSSAVRNTFSSLPPSLPENGLGTTRTTDYLLGTLLPGCLQAQNGPRYFGFVTGGVTEAAQLADIVASSYDENVMVSLPGVTASTAIEARTLELVLDLLDIPRGSYQGRTITTGATASNVLGLGERLSSRVKLTIACARDHLYGNSPHLPKGFSYAQSDPPSGPNLPSPPVIVLSLHPHFSITKAASLVGIGGGPNVVHTLPSAHDDELAFDLDVLRNRLVEEKEVGRGVIVAYGLGEVNTGGFGRGLEEVAKMCRDYGAWLHVDAGTLIACPTLKVAFGGFAGAVPELRGLVKGMDMADSLTLDGRSLSTA